MVRYFFYESLSIYNILNNYLVVEALENDE